MSWIPHCLWLASSVRGGERGKPNKHVCCVDCVRVERIYDTTAADRILDAMCCTCRISWMVLKRLDVLLIFSGLTPQGGLLLAWNRYDRRYKSYFYKSALRMWSLQNVSFWAVLPTSAFRTVGFWQYVYVTRICVPQVFVIYSFFLISFDQRSTHFIKVCFMDTVAWYFASYLPFR